MRKSDFFIMRADIYKDGTFLKFLENFEIKNVNSILTPYKAVMMMADENGKTELRIKSVEYNKPVSDSTLSKESLR